MRQSHRRSLLVTNSFFVCLGWASIAAAQQAPLNPDVVQPSSGAPTPVATTPAATPSTTTPALTSSTTTDVVSTTTTTSATGTDGSALPTTPARVDEVTTEHKSFINRPLMVTGLVLFGGTYAASVIVGAESDRASDHNYLYYPVVGPWMDLANRDCTLSTCANETLSQALLIADGAVQGIGALAVLTSLVVPERTTKKWYLIGNDTVSVAPGHVGRTGYGIGAHGVF